MTTPTSPERTFLERHVRCPRCGQRSLEWADPVRCRDCGSVFPEVGGVPNLITTGALGGPALSPPGRPRAGRRRLPLITRELTGGAVIERMGQRLPDVSASVLVIGAGRGGQVAPLLPPGTIVIDTDVVPDVDVDVLLDAHDLPFEDQSFDAVVAEAVLEHVLDPVCVVAEIHRILRPSGSVFASTPFMQQVHEGAFDFTRWTHLGHRRLFRSFDEVESGIAVGPGSALAWSVKYFLLSFGASAQSRRLLGAAAHLMTFWLKWFDGWLRHRPGAYDAASGFYFLGSSRYEPLSDAEILRGYRGCQGG